MPRLGTLSNAALRRIVLLSAALLLVRIASAMIVDQPGYTDAYYYHDVARRLAAGQGLSADFVWNPLEAPPGSMLPVPSHRFWMPLATALQALGIVLLPFLDSFRASQALTIGVAAFIPAAGYAAARAVGAGERTALITAALVGLGGVFAPGWVSLDAFAPAAVLGTLFFIAYGRAARGDVRAGALAGALVGLLFLARAEAAIFGVVLLILATSPRTRRAGVAGSAVALCIGIGWLARDLSLGPSPDIIGRSVLLIRYDQFFATQAPGWSGFVEVLPDVLAAKAAALGTNAGTFIFAFFVLLLPGMFVAVRSRRRDPTVRAFAVVLALIYLFQSLVVTLHSVRGSYLHSLAAFLPYGIALGVAGTAELLARRSWDRRAIGAIAAVGVAGVGIFSGYAVAQWDAAFNAPYRARVAALERIPDGPFLAVDAAAWRWIAGRTVVVTPSEGIAAAACYVQAAGIRSIVLEPVHFAAYDDLYRGRAAGEAGREAGMDIRVYRLPLPPDPARASPALVRC